MKAAHRRSLLGSTALATVMTVAWMGGAEAQPAVAYQNGSLGGFAGSNDGNGFGAGEWRWTTPLGPTTGAQFDGFAGVMGSKPMAQVAGHLFWRNPQTALFGLFGAWTTEFNKSTFRIGPEVELYQGPVTLSAVGGVESGDNATGGFFQGKLNYYATPDTKLYAGGGYDGHGFGMVGVEHQFQSSGWAGFGEVRFGDSTSAWAGLRYYFGGPGKTLMGREREDVAPLWTFMAKEPTVTTTSTSTSTSTTTPI